jgi:hypothetical protein
LQNANLKVGATLAVANATEQGWPGRAILEYDSWIQGCEGCGPNFGFLLINDLTGKDAPVKSRHATII